VVGTGQSSNGGVSVLRGVGDGSFAAAVTYDVGSTPSAVALADVNGDGVPDLLTANNTGSNISVVLGNGDGTFRVGANYSVMINATSVAAADLTGNGIPDAVTTSITSHNALSVLLGNGDGTYQPAAFYDTNHTAFGVTVADLAGDGIPDLVVPSTDSFGQPGYVEVLMGNGDGTFKPAVSYALGAPTGKVVAADFNGDGKLDLAVGSFSFTGDSVTILLGNGDGTFQAPQTFSVASALGLAEGDFNGDGIPDLIAFNQTANTVDVLLGNGDGTFKPAISTPVAAGPYTMVVGDFNGDGIPDVAVASSFGGGQSTVNILLGNGDGSFQPASTSLAAAPTVILAGDINGDGVLDLVTNGSNGTGPQTVWLGNGDGTFQAPQSYYSSVSITSMALADRNGLPDLITVNGNSKVTVLVNAADWGSSPHRPSQRVRESHQSAMLNPTRAESPSPVWEGTVQTTSSPRASDPIAVDFGTVAPAALPTAGEPRPLVRVLLGLPFPIEDAVLHDEADLA